MGLIDRLGLIIDIWCYAMRQWPRRLLRLWTMPFMKIHMHRSFLVRVLDSPAEVLCTLMDIFFWMEIYMSLCLLIKSSSRMPTMREELIIKSMNLSIPTKLIHLDSRALIGPSWSPMAYVSGWCINCWKGLHDHTLVHELIHLWQYDRYGSVYIYHALRAQHMKEGYAYGGVEAIRQAVRDRRDIRDFNFEQQGDILADSFRIRRTRSYVLGAWATEVEGDYLQVTEPTRI